MDCLPSSIYRGRTAAANPGVGKMLAESAGAEAKPKLQKKKA